MNEHHSDSSDRAQNADHAQRSDHELERARRTIVSFVRRSTKLTPKLQKAWDRYASRYVLAIPHADPKRDLSVDPRFRFDRAYLIQQWGNANPLTVEIGTGQGENIAAAAAKHPDRNYLAVEVYAQGIAHTLHRIGEQHLTNLRIAEVNAPELFETAFASGLLDEVWTWFPDPWPKMKHHKRRIVQAPLADAIYRCLKPQGLWRIATDIDDYALHIHEVMDDRAGWINLGGKTVSLATQHVGKGDVDEAREMPHADFRESPRFAGRVITSFEHKGLEKGHTVHDFAYQKVPVGAAFDRAENATGTSSVHHLVNRASTALFAGGYRYIVKPILFHLPADQAHAMTLDFAGAAGHITPLMGLLRSMINDTDPVLRTTVMGIPFENPLGLSAGLDKNGTLWQCLDAAGFGFETVGSTTARPCKGNQHPWFHRLPKYHSLVIHAGLPNDGSETVMRRVEKAYVSAQSMRLSVSIARTNDLLCGDDEEGIEDYATSFRRAVGKSHLIEVNISCPNTYVGQRYTVPDRLDQLLSALDQIDRPQPVLVKMPQDKSWPEFRDLLDVICEHRVQGVTIANLKQDRTGVAMPSSWQGGLSGDLARPGADSLIEKTYRDYGSRLVIAGVGGVNTPEQAYWKIRHGASLVMLISSLMFNGPQHITTLKRGLAQLLHRDGFVHVADAVGVDVK